MRTILHAFGAPAVDGLGRVPFASIQPAGVYADQVGGAAAGAVFVKTTAGVNRPGGSEKRSRLNRIRIIGLTLTDFVATPAAAANGDTGVFVSAVGVVANSHGLPLNFGPGQGNWVADDVALLDVLMQSDDAPAGDGTNPAIGVAMAVAAGELTITIHNAGLAAEAHQFAGACILQYHEEE